MSKRKDRKPGAGLSQIFPSHEGPTGKMDVIEHGKEKCPKCGGSTMIGFERVGEPDRLPTVHEFGVYRPIESCDLCTDGYVSLVEADAYRENKDK